MQSLKATTASRGFTLMEIMLVLVLLGCMAKLVLGTFPSSDKINQESDRLAVALQWAAHQAELDGKVYGLSVSHDKWQLMTLNNQSHNKGESYLWPHHYWHPINDAKLKQQRQLPDGLTLELTLQDQPIPLSGMRDDGLINEPKVIFFPGGESSLFELTLSGKEGQTRRITAQGVQSDTESSRPMTFSYNKTQGN